MKTSWNKGLTKETDERVMKSTNSRKITLENNPNIMKKLSEDRKKYLMENPEKLKETNLKHSKTLQSNKELRIKIGSYHKGDISPSKRPEVREKIKKTLTGRKDTEETKINKSKNNSHFWLKKERPIETRIKISSTLKEIPLEKWNSFSKDEEYSKRFNKVFKKKIRDRDNHICMKCGIHQEKLSKTLPVHHINYDKSLTIPENCISLCNKCHNETNLNRVHWINFFQSLLSEKYGYKYSKEEDIILNLNGELNEI